ncbi:MAG: S46 family peptidase [Bryobacteraceae bacterium]
MNLRILALAAALALPAASDEGMWLFNLFPKDKVKEAYSIDLPGGFVDNLRLASLSVGPGSASGAFVSAHGLLVTNHHVVAGCLARLGLLQNGYYAADLAAERKCPDFEARELVSIEEVTSQVKETGAKEPAKDSKTAAAALEKRNGRIAQIEQDCAARSGHLCQVVELYSGARYDLYQYKVYPDLRLVFAPEQAIAFFGGNPESLTYPRYDLDVAFLRAYAGNRPADTPHFLKWSQNSIRENELVFAVGNPVGTARANTVAQLTFLRDTAIPASLTRLQQRIEDLRAFAYKSSANARLALIALADLSTAYKLTAGKMIGLEDDLLLARKLNFERKLRAAVTHDPKLGADAAKVWDEVAAAFKTWAPNERAYQVLEAPAAQGSQLFRAARELVRHTPGATQAGALDPAVETVLLTRYLEELRSLGEKDAPLRAILGHMTPQQAAQELVKNTRLGDAAERRLTADPSLLERSDDPLLRLARELDSPARKIAKKHDETIGALETSSSERIAQYRYAIFGAADYPDATGTPRLAFGSVKGYLDRTQAPVPFATTYGGLYYLASKLPPHVLPERWSNGKPSIDQTIPLDFATTCDIAAGPNGGPVVNAKGELVGVTFDGNLESTGNSFLYSDDQARAVHVATRGIAEALARLYGARRLLEELGVTLPAEASPSAP